MKSVATKALVMNMAYRKQIIARIDSQTRKGIRKYGNTIDRSGHIQSASEGLEYLAEELTDGLVYIEHSKRLIAETERENAQLTKQLIIAMTALKAIQRGDGQETRIAAAALKDMGLE